MVNLASMAGKDGNTCRGLRLVANAWRLYRQAVLQPALPRLAVLLARISDATRLAMVDGFQEKLLAAGYKPYPDPAPEAARRFVREESDRWTPVIETIGSKRERRED